MERFLIKYINLDYIPYNLKIHFMRNKSVIFTYDHDIFSTTHQNTEDVKRDIEYVKRDIEDVKRDIKYVKRDIDDVEKDIKM